MRRGFLVALLCMFIFALVPCARAESPRTLDAAAINANLGPPAAEQKAHEVKVSTWPLVVPKTLLKGVPAADRAEFMGGLLLVNGAVAEVQNDILQKHFGAGFYRPLSALCPNSGDEERYYHEKPSRHARLGTLLKDVPEKVRREFLDNLAFENGRLVSAYVAGIRKKLDPQDFGRLLDQLACASGKRPTASEGAVCGAGWCTSSSCRAVGDIPDQRPGDIACFSSCLLAR